MSIKKKFSWYEKAIIFISLSVLVWGSLGLINSRISVIREYLPDFLLSKNEKAILQNTSYLSPVGMTGTCSNTQNVNSSNNVYATCTAVGQTIIVSNFSLLQSEGGSIPEDSRTYIQGFDIEVEGNEDCFGGNYQTNFTLSKDGGATYYTETQGHSQLFNSGSDSEMSWSEGYGSVSIINDLGGTATNGDSPIRWNYTDISNKNFRVKFQVSSVCAGNLNIDNIKINVGFTNPPTNNITTSDLDNPEIYHLSISDITNPINLSNIYVYIPFDWNDTVHGTGGLESNTLLRQADYHPNSLEPYDFGNIDPIINSTCGIIGNGACFNGSIPGVTINRGDGYLFYGTDNFTIGYWAFVNATSNGRRTFTGTNHYMALRNTGVMAWELFNATATALKHDICASPYQYSRSQWEYWTAVWIRNSSGGFALLYQNGSLAVTCSVPMMETQLMTVDRIGGTGTASTNWRGNIDQFIIIKTALNSSQVADLYNNQSKIFYPRGELVFSNLNIAPNNTLNLSVSGVVPIGTSINVSFGRKSGASYIYDNEFAFSGLSLNNSIIDTPSNYSIKYIFYSDANQDITPIINRSDIKSYYQQPCYYTGGNWAINCSNNCNINRTSYLDSGSNITVFGDGNMSFTSNLTGWNNFIFGSTGNACTGILLNGNRVTPR